MSGQELSPVYVASGLVLRPDISAQNAAKALALLPPPQQALAIAAAFNRAMEDANKGDASNAAEHLGRRIEKVMDELPDFQATLQEMIEAGDTEVVLNMVRGRVGEEDSSAAQHLDVGLIALLFEKDADMNDRGEHGARLVNMAWTLVKGTPVEHRGVNLFFLATEEGQELVQELRAMDGCDEEIQQILRSLREREYHLPTDTEEDESK